MESKVRVFNNKIYCLEHEELLDTFEESQLQNSTGSDDNGDHTGDNDPAERITNGKEKENDAAKAKKEETLPPKKRGPKPQADHTEKPANGTAAKRGRKGSVKGEQGTKGSVSDDPLAVAPMFDDDEEEEFGLVIDIPNF